MTKKTGIIFALSVFGIVFISIIGYFSIQYIVDKDFQENTIRCSNDTEKRKESFKEDRINVYENFYSKKLKTCLIIGHDKNLQNGELVSMKLIIKELYTGKNLDSFVVADSDKEYETILNYNNSKITDLFGVTKEELKNICSNEDKQNPLKQYCSLIKYWSGREKWETATNNYR